MFFNTVSIQKKYFIEIAKIQSTNIPLFFVGMMGSGKTTLGRIVAQVLQYDFIEMDMVIEERLGISIKEIFENYGEEYFRKEEKKLLEEICLKQKCVISCGGGVFTNSENIEKISKSGIAIFLNVSSRVLEERLSGDEKRPLLKENSIHKILLKRIPFYTQAHVMVDLVVSNLEKNVCQVIEEIYRYLS
jgi:shikimate kinase